MRSLSTCVVLLLSLLLCAPCLLAGEPTADDLIKEFRGEADAQKRTPKQLEAAYAKVLDSLVPQITGDDPGPRQGPEQGLERICWRAGRPGADAERLALCTTIAARLKADVPQQARIWLTKQLLHIGRDEAVDALAPQLAHKEPRVREWTRRALQNNPSPNAADALRAALAKATSPEWRVALINALANRTDKPTVQALIRQASEGNDLVRSAAIEALGAIGDGAADDVLRAGMTKGSDRAKAIATDNTLLLADKLADKGDKPAALAIYKALLGATRHIRCAAIIGLGRAGGADELPTIFQALASKDTRERGAALAALELLPPKAVLEAMTAKLAAAPPEMKTALLRALSRRGDKAILPAFVAAAADANQAVRIAAFEGLGKLGDERAAATLVPALLKAQGNEAGAVKAAIGRIPGKAVTDALLAAMPRAEPAARAELVRCIAVRRGDPIVGPLLRVAQADADPSVRGEALKALASLADEGHLAQLVGLVVKPKDDRDRGAAEKAVVAVCKSIDDESKRAKPVLAALDGASVPARVSLLTVLALLGGDDALAAVRAARKDPNAKIQDTTIRLLARWDDPKVADELLDIARNAKSLAHRVVALDGYVRAVGMLAHRPAADLLKMYDAAMTAAPRPEDRKRVLSGMAQVGNLGALRMAQQYLGDKALKAEAEAAVVQIARTIGGSHRTEAKSALKAISQSTTNKRLARQAKGALATLERFEDYIVAWQVAGPFTKSGKDGSGLFNKVFPPEKPDAKDVKWQPIPPGTDKKRPWVVEIDQVRSIRGNQRVAYLRTRVWSPKKQSVRMELGSDDGVKAWLNAKLVHANNATRPCAPAQDKRKVTLNEGWNDVLLKITQGGGHWEACLRFRAPDGSKLDGIKAQVGGQ